jgi:CheY-like chemotaxis protein
VLFAQLEAWGLRVTTVAEGFTALAELARARVAGDPYHVALLDRQMPGMNGVALGRAIKADGKLRDTRLALLTSMGERIDAREMELLGFRALLSKPLRAAALLDCLRALVGGPKTDHAAGSESVGPVAPLQRWRGARILVAEDHHTTRQVALGSLAEPAVTSRESRVDPAELKTESARSSATLTETTQHR